MYRSDTYHTYTGSHAVLDINQCCQSDTFSHTIDAHFFQRFKSYQNTQQSVKVLIWFFFFKFLMDDNNCFSFFFFRWRFPTLYRFMVTKSIHMPIRLCDLGHNHVVTVLVVETSTELHTMSSSGNISISSTFDDCNGCILKSHISKS